MPGLTTDAETPEMHHCPTCGDEWSDEDNAAACCRVYECSWCGAEHRSDDDAYFCCRHTCDGCGAEYRHEDEAAECCRYACPGCGLTYDYESEANACCGTSFHGYLPTLPDVDPYWVEVADHDGRPARLCSLEQELVEGGAAVAKLLYQIGISDSDSVGSYHSSSAHRPGRAHVEEDGSLPSAGGEVVYDRFNLSRHDDIASMSEALTKIRQLRDVQTPRLVKTGFAAGIHVHISARAEDGTMFGPGAVATLYELWCYAEDMLYSLSASGWNRHRQPADNYSGYCKPVPKAQGAQGPHGVWSLMRSDRYYGLNFRPLFQCVDRCSCGAATMGDWQACNCGAFDRGTIEWRVFNASTLPRTIHAWLLMAHAMTAYAANHSPSGLAANPYGSSTPAEKREVLEDLLYRLPLTDGERDVIREAADRSPGL
jgi:hypothetical protein